MTNENGNGGETPTTPRELTDAEKKQIAADQDEVRKWLQTLAHTTIHNHLLARGDAAAKLVNNLAMYVTKLAFHGDGRQMLHTKFRAGVKSWLAPDFNFSEFRLRLAERKPLRDKWAIVAVQADLVGIDKRYREVAVEGGDIPRPDILTMNDHEIDRKVLYG